MGAIKEVKKKIHKGLSITNIEYSQDSSLEKTYKISFSDGDAMRFFFEKTSSKKFDNFLYLTKIALERKAKEKSKHKEGCKCCLCLKSKKK